MNAREFTKLVEKINGLEACIKSYEAEAGRMLLSGNIDSQRLAHLKFWVEKRQKQLAELTETVAN